MSDIRLLKEKVARGSSYFPRSLVVELLDELASRDEQTGNHLMWMAEQGTIITGLRDELKERDDLIKRLVALGDALIAYEAVFVSQEQAEHYTTVIEEWRALMKELEG